MERHSLSGVEGSSGGTRLPRTSRSQGPLTESRWVVFVLAVAGAAAVIGALAVAWPALAYLVGKLFGG